jgi:CheY-like chemotaxis protein
LDISGSNILVADDDRIVRRIVVAKLTGLGYNVDQVEDGQEALEFLEKGGVPDLLITDSLMPRMSGLELVRSIRSNADMAALPVIMLTSRRASRTSSRASRPASTTTSPNRSRPTSWPPA